MDLGRSRNYYIDDNRHELSKLNPKFSVPEVIPWPRVSQLNFKGACVRMRLFCFKGCPARRRVGRRGVQAAAVAAVVSEVVKA